VALEVVETRTCDGCPGAADVRPYRVEVRKTDRSGECMEFDGCSDCERDLTLTAWRKLAFVGMLPSSLRRRARRSAGKRGGVPGVDLRVAVSAYESMRKEVGVPRGELRRDSRALAALLNVSGNVGVRHLSSRQVGWMRDTGLAAEDAAALDMFFEWCRWNRWMRREQDPFDNDRGSLPPTPDPTNGLRAAACAFCPRGSYVAELAIWRAGTQVLSADACIRCQRKSVGRLLDTNVS
jgi:hypothetical protein